MPLRFLIIGLVMLTALFCHAQEGEYAVSRISPDLIKGANAVVRTDDSRFEILSPRETVLTNHYVITILNEAGEGMANFEEYYYKYRQIASLEGALYDASGKQIRKVKKKDFEDLSGVGEGTLMDDIRVKRHSFYWRSYPYTIDYTVEIVNKGSLFFPVWLPQRREGISVEKCTMSIVNSPNYQFRYKTFNYDGLPVKHTEKGKEVSFWSVNNLKAISRAPYSPNWHEMATMVLYGPTDFQIDDFKGNMSSWDEFGLFTYQLVQGRDKLPENVKRAVHDITDGLNDQSEKVSRLYEYMQKNTRYISIQLGMGGWQPFDATFVATHGYGDCKALSNYMYSLLKEAGIQSYYTLVRSGRNARYITADFPSQQFNHVILCVPLEKDTVWLECTSQTLPAGYMSDMTSNRYALLIGEKGGKLVRTPNYGKEENRQLRKIEGELKEKGDLEITVYSEYQAVKQDDIQYLISHLSRDKVKEYLHDQLDFATYDITRFEYRENKSSMPVVDEKLNMVISNYASITGKRLFLLPNIMTRSYRNLSADSSRRWPVELNNEFTETDTVIIKLPAGYQAEAIPPAIELKSRFGNFSCSTSIKEGVMTYYRHLEQSSGKFPATDYAELVKFYQTVFKADRSRIVLVRGN